MDPVNPTLDDLQKRFETLYPAARIGKSLRAIVAEGSVNPDEIVPLVRLEPLLTARILREANLLPDRKPEGYTSLEEALTALGFQRMYDLLGLYSYPRGSEDRVFPTDLWKRSITCAICMEILADKHNLDQHQAYAIGLIHSLAEAVVSKDDEEIESAPEFDHINNRLQMYNRSGLCYSMLKEWGLPTSLIDPIRFQYSPLDCKTTGKLACLLNLSKWITGVIREVDEVPDQALGPDLLVLNLLGEGEQTLWNIVTDVSDALHQADSIIQGDYTAC
ncbi:HDOD domain-containing protein [Pelagicoccus albus]|uniref:HDOD domain-containing protein n=1 Tax=Pelagicoccus albus TaxID=415222 RepID=A0A7X1B751_9BACT|nr:HDOD domain-containing protein [Pelagicoccus albus]MBC2606882.1 HDOD domain-containing protein [Pelagicoccus albus]